MRPLDAFPGRRCVAADPIDVELVQRPRKLCISRPIGRLGLVGSKDARLVTVQRQRLPIAARYSRIASKYPKVDSAPVNFIHISRLVASSTLMCLDATFGG